jgi:hypothetical protein
MDYIGDSFHSLLPDSSAAEGPYRPVDLPTATISKGTTCKESYAVCCLYIGTPVTRTGTAAIPNAAATKKVVRCQLLCSSSEACREDSH